MGTNFYFLTKDKGKRDKWFGYTEYRLTDDPDWGYMIHLAKTSCGWRPLFQGHKKVNSVKIMKKIYDEGGFQIIDEYGNIYDWFQFKDRVIDFNKNNVDAYSHPEYENGRYKDLYYLDEDGYEFTREDFS